MCLRASYNTNILTVSCLLSRRCLWEKVMKKGTVAFQAQVRGHQARLRVLALRYLNACLLAQKLVRGFIKRSRVSIGEACFCCWYAVVILRVL